MILLIVEGASDKIFCEHLLRDLLQISDKIVVEQTRGIDRMLRETLPHAIRLLQASLYTKVIAIFDRDKMNEPYDKKKTRIERLRELVHQHPSVGGFPFRENLEDLIQNCLRPATKRRDFWERVRRSKEVAVRWAIKHKHLDEDLLRNRLTDLQRSLNCYLMKDF
jgi:hypothetical protein